MDIRDRVAIVTGGASGLGAGTARYWVQHGGIVVILDRDTERGERLAQELGDNALCIGTDVTKEDAVGAALHSIAEQFGGVHVVVNCAGVGTADKVLSNDGPVDLSVFEFTIRVNLIGTFNVIRLAANHMQHNEPTSDESERGVIINTASVAAFDGQIGQAAYSASKGGIVSMTLPIAREFARYGIRVMTIAPGIFDTPMLAALPEKVRTSLGQQVPFPQRLGKAEEYAALVGHIVQNPMLNGEVIRLDGAIRMTPK